MRWLLGLALSALIAYFTATGALREELATVKATTQQQFHEVLRSLARIENDIRELRRQP